MKELLYEVGLPIAGVILAGFLFLALPIAWFDGHAKQHWLKQTKNIDIPWYEATWLEISITNTDAEVKFK